MLYKRASDLINASMSNANDFLNNKEDGEENVSGDSSASDYILVAMIVSMLLCMAVCCLCLFCRTSSSRFTLCGWNFEINDRNASVGIDELSELHEVVPLTPTSTNAHNITDIEQKLKSDPPPPLYSEVTSISVFERFRRKNKRRDPSAADDKSEIELGANVKRKRSDRRSFTRFFQRSVSYQPPRVTNFKSTTGNFRKCSQIKEADSSTLSHLDKRPSKLSLPKSSSEVVFGRSISVLDELKFYPSQDDSKNRKPSFEKDEAKGNHSQKSSGSSKDLSSGCYDDEVFM